MKLQVSSSPHIRDQVTTASIMRDVILATVPAIIAAGYFFGLRAIIVILISVLSCVIFEYLSRRIMKRDQTVSDLSAVVTGVLLAFNLPPTLPYYMVVIGAFFAIVVVKQMFGGLGNNFVNPALTARIILAIGFPQAMILWAPAEGPSRFVESLQQVDLVSSATPLAILKNQGLQGAEEIPSFLSLFLGDKAGCIGEISIIALLIGVIYLVSRKIITLWIPLTYIGTVMLLTLFMGYHNVFELFSSGTPSTDLMQLVFREPLYMLLSGGLVVGAFFMATDYVTSPITTRGRILFGLGCGLITVLIRYYGSSTEGVSFSIVLMNILTPHLDRLTKPKVFGEVTAHEKA